MNREDILKDIASFADDENQIIKEHNCIMFSRFGKDITINIHEDYDGKYGLNVIIAACHIRYSLRMN